MKLKELVGVLIHDKPIKIYTFVGNEYKDLFIGRLSDLYDESILNKYVDAIFTNKHEISILLV